VAIRRWRYRTAAGRAASSFHTETGNSDNFDVTSVAGAPRFHLSWDGCRSWGRVARHLLTLQLSTVNQFVFMEVEYVVEFHTLLQRVQSEFLEMPGLRLTPAQAGRLLGLDPQACQRVITELVSAAFLRWTPDGRIVRAES
jgi:hypothetical protein